MFAYFIKRPILSLVISLFFMLLGLLALIGLPITQYPDIVPPTVVVTARYTGANADVGSKAVATPLERAINGVAGMTSMNTVCTNGGLTLISIQFEVGTDPDVAAVNVQNRVITVLDELPEEVIKNGVITEKEVNGMLMYLNIMSHDTTVDEKFVYNFADITLLRELKRIEGVGYAEIMGARDYSMRVWLKPDRMAVYEVSTEEVIEAIRESNVEAAPGKVGEGSGKLQLDLQYPVNYRGKFFKESDYEEIPIRAQSDGSILRLKDIADIEFGSADYHMISRTNGKPSASIMIKQRPESNASDVIRKIKQKLEELEETDFPDGMYYSYSYDVSKFLDASINDVIKTLFEAFLLVFIVIFIFLQDLRSTLIPALAVPVALVGTFTFLLLFGFSINLLTLFALILAIGIVVDNAIVVVEAVHQKMESEKLNPTEASIAAMNEIGGAIVAITLVMAAVFVPVAFLSGTLGIFYRQFSVTLAVAIVISGVNALTLTPALCALLMKPSHNEHKGVLGKFFKAFNRSFNSNADGYRSFIGRQAKRKAAIMGIMLLFYGITIGSKLLLSTEFIPQEDQGLIYVDVRTPEGSTVERSSSVLKQIYAVASKHEDVESVSTLAGYNILTESSGASFGFGMINLKDWGERKKSATEVKQELFKELSFISDAQVDLFFPPTVPGFGNASGVEFRLVDKNSDYPLDSLNNALTFLKGRLSSEPGVSSVGSSFSLEFPQYTVEIDPDIAAQKGVSTNNILRSLQTFLGSYYASNFIRFGQMYKVYVQASPEFRTNPESITKLFVKNELGQMVSLSSLVTLRKISGPDQITRFNMYNSALVNVDINKGNSTGDIIESINTISKDMPQGYGIEWSGMTREEVIAGNSLVIILLICLVFVYLLLAAQYESFALPLVVLIPIPAGLFGAFMLTGMVGMQDNIFTQVSLVMLIGLLGKNAILIVEVANQRYQSGQSAIEAALNGARERLRPVLMTSFAFSVGLIPMLLGSGAGEMGARSIGAASIGGMVSGTILGLLIIPVLFMVIAPFTKRKI
jgi:hydrophobic/amphiphilic exporter-1 (mainly G- bacteria), HAE1 family